MFLTDFTNTVYLSSKSMISTVIGSPSRLQIGVDFINKNKKETTVSKPQTYADIVLCLPVDETFKAFMIRHDLPLPEGWSWHDNTHTSHKLIKLIQGHPNTVKRDRIIAGLHASSTLAHPLGKQAMFQATHAKPNELVGLIACENDLHRSFWLYVNHPDLFEAAAEIEYLDQHSQQAQA
jgi:hypothetical protein